METLSYVTLYYSIQLDILFINDVLSSYRLASLHRQ